MTKKTKIILVVVAILLVAVISYFIFRKKASANTVATIPAADTSNKPITNDNFPLNVGSQGENVKRLQMALNRIKPTDKLIEDGVFASKTRVKLLLTLPVTLSKLPMDEVQLNAIIKQANNS